MIFVRILQTRAVDLDDLGAHVVAPARRLRVVVTVSQRIQYAAGEGVSGSVRIDGLDRKARLQVYFRALVLADVGALLGTGYEHEFAERRDFFNDGVHIVPAGKVFRFLGIAKDDVAVIFDDLLEVVAEIVYQEGVRERERHGDVVLLRLLEGLDGRLLRIRAGPEITLDVDNLAVLEHVRVDVGFLQLRGHAEVRAHGPLGVRRRKNDTGTGGAGGFGHGLDLEADAGLREVAPVELAVRVVGDFAGINAGTTGQCNVVHGVAGRSAGPQLHGFVLEIVEDVPLAVAFDQGHDALCQAVFFEKVIVHEDDGVHEGVAHSVDVIFAILIYTCHSFTFSRRYLRATKMTDTGSPVRHACKQLLDWTLRCWIVLLAHRLLFTLAYLPANTDLVTLAEQFCLGFWFDFSTLPVLLLPIALFLPLYSAGWPLTNRLVRAFELAQWIYLGVCNVVLAASTYNFAFNGKHLGWELFAYLNDLSTLIGGVAERSPLLLPLAVLIALGFAAGGWLLLRRSPAPVYSQETRTFSLPLRIFAIFLSQVCIMGIMSLAIRGGFQDTPLRSPDAIRYGTAYLNNVPLNGLFTVSRDAEDRSDFVRFYDPAENVAAVRTLLDPRPNAFLSDEYPLLRRMPPRRLAGERKAPNIVLVILESFTAKYLATHGGDPRIAPNFERLSRDGLYFERFMASGGRSANGLFCMFAGLPDRANRTILRSNEAQNRMGGLARILRDNHEYRTIFVHGGDLRFDSLDRMLPHLGFETAVGWREMEADRAGLGLNEDDRRTSWGFLDHVSFRVAETLIDDAAKRDDGRPFFATVFTLNTHHPYLVPNGDERIFDAAQPQHDFLNSYHATDKALGAFLDKLRTKSYYNNTIFVFTADHAHHAQLNYLEDRHIPLLIYAPGRNDARLRGRRTDLASQLDLLPTIFGLAGGDGVYAAMGRDLLHEDTPSPHAYYAGGSGTGAIGWIQGELMLMQWIGAENRILLTARHPADVSDLFPEHPDIGAAFVERSRHFHQFARYLEQNNRIWPPASTGESDLQTTQP